MQVPFYFLDKREIDDLQYIVDIYRYISQNPTDLLSYDDEIAIFKKLKNRKYLKNKEVIAMISIVTITIVGSEIVKCEFDFDIIKYKELLMKLTATHQEILEDEDFVDNIQLFDCIYKTIKQSIDELNITIYEKNMYCMLELLYI